MANRQSLLLLSLEHLTTAPSYRPKRRERLITLQCIVPQFSQRPIPRRRDQRTMLLAPTGLRNQTTSRKRTDRRQRSRIIGRKRTVRRQRSRIIGRKRTVRRQRSRIIGRKRTDRRQASQVIGRKRIVRR